MVRFRELRATVKTGSDRAAAFFRENLDRPTHRSVVTALLHDQHDPLKRLRGGGGARDKLRGEGVALLSKHYGGALARALGRPIKEDEFVAIRPSTLQEAEHLRSAGVIA